MNTDFASSGNARYWVGILYPENMIDGWQDDIADIVQVSYAYCVHDKDLDADGDDRKVHLHLILAFPNTTTYKHAKGVFSLLSAPGKSALNQIKKVISIRGSYDYLIHDTDACRKKGKHLYDKSERISGNNFDIGSFEQLGIAEKNELCKELCNVIIDNMFCNFADFYIHVVNSYEDTNYFEILKSYSGLFERLTKANFQRFGGFCVASNTDSNTDSNTRTCLFCGKPHLKKNGKTAQNRQRWFCQDCFKSFSEG